MVTRQRFDERLRAFGEDVLKMGTLVEEAIRKATAALVNKDVDQARKVAEDDKTINQMELDIQDECIVCIATEQPVAHDLRTLITIIKLVGQLERIGDHAVHIANSVVRLADENYMKDIIDIPRMAEVAIGMIHDVLTAFIEDDYQKAIEVAMRDDQIDHLHDQVMRECFTYMMEDPKYIRQSTSFLFVSRFMERIGDHVTNISEWILYNSTGEHRELNRQD